LQSVMWAAWANMMYDKTNNPTYKEIFDIKINKLKKEA
jgi:hypothetical protein